MEKHQIFKFEQITRQIGVAANLNATRQRPPNCMQINQYSIKFHLKQVFIDALNAHAQLFWMTDWGSQRPEGCAVAKLLRQMFSNGHMEQLLWRHTTDASANHAWNYDGREIERRGEQRSALTISSDGWVATATPTYATFITIAMRQHSCNGIQARQLCNHGLRFHCGPLLSLSPLAATLSAWLVDL